MQAPLLVASALKRRDVTYTNISPAPHTWRTLQAQGFEPYNFGRSAIFALPGRGRQNVMSCQLRCRINKCQTILQLIPETNCPAGLIKRGTAPEA